MTREQISRAIKALEKRDLTRLHSKAGIVLCVELTYHMLPMDEPERIYKRIAKLFNAGI